MRLSDLTKFNPIVVQCHDNPDADAIASGYGIYYYLKRQGCNVRFIYSGKFQIQKSNLVLMVRDLRIPIEYVEPGSLEAPDLLITADCQYGEGNVTAFEAQNIAVIDHHQVSRNLPELSEVSSGLGACSTLVYHMLLKEGIDVNADPGLSTALYFGLLTDTGNFTELHHPLDRDLRDGVAFSESLIRLFRNSNFSSDELAIASDALSECYIDRNRHFAIAQAKPCDPNILGMISDIILEVDVVSSCVVYSILPFGIKLSVRSCVKEIQANELADFLVTDVGNGGGHMDKAGGFIQKELLGAQTNDDISKFIQDRMVEYYSGTEIIYASEYTADLSTMKSYRKVPTEFGYVKVSDIVPLGESIQIRTLEGDIDIVSDDDTYLLIGIKGEIYPNTSEKFKRNYIVTEKPFTKELEYFPTIKFGIDGTRIGLMHYAKTCISSGKGLIYGRSLDHRVKIFTQWTNDRYYLGKVNDMMAARYDDPSDVYIIARDVFEKTYEPVD